MFTPRDGRVCIVLDRTGSMEKAINTMKEMLAGYVIRRAAEWGIEELGLITFDDHYDDIGWEETLAISEQYPDRYISRDPIKIYGTTNNLEEYMYWLHTVPTGDGADLPEAIACALAAARQLMPNTPIWLITDSIPHEKCPCGIDLDLTDVNVVFPFSKDNINYIFFHGYWWAKNRPIIVDMSTILQDGACSSMVRASGS